MTRTDFVECLQYGQSGEALIEKHFSDRWDIQPATTEQQKLGIDRVFKNQCTGEAYTIEIKTDTVAAKTGNAFLEIAKHLNPYRPGWVYTCQADFLFYLVPHQMLIVVRPNTLRLHIESWLISYPLRNVKSEGKHQNYQTQGVLVPLDELAKTGGKVITL